MSSVLIINPNSNVEVTNNLKEIIEPAPDFSYKFFTAPSGPAEIDSRTTEVLSASICLQALLPMLTQYDSFVVACYSDHPLLHCLREHTSKPVLGIFQASVLHALAFGGKFAIVTTTIAWEPALNEAVHTFLGTDANFAGTFSTGLNIHELQTLSKSEIQTRFSAAASRAVDEGAKTICLGCAGMAGMEEMIKNAVGGDVRVVDGVVAATEIVVGMVRSVNMNK